MELRFIDLCAGIGGFRFALEKFGAECVMTSEIDEKTRRIYSNIFSDSNIHGDLFDISPDDIPDHSILCAGFPCQPFSSSGKKLGFNDQRGNVFFGILRIIDEKNPSLVFLENVKNLEKHDYGRTMTVIVRELETRGYHVSYAVLNSKNMSEPQNRERVYIIASKSKEFSFADLEQRISDEGSLHSFLNAEREYIEADYTIIPSSEWKRQKSGLIFCRIFQ